MFFSNSNFNRRLMYSTLKTFRQLLFSQNHSATAKRRTPNQPKHKHQLLHWNMTKWLQYRWGDFSINASCRYMCQHLSVMVSITGAQRLFFPWIYCLFQNYWYMKGSNRVLIPSRQSSTLSARQSCYPSSTVEVHRSEPVAWQRHSNRPLEVT